MRHIENREELWSTSRQKRQKSITNDAIYPESGFKHFFESPLACGKGIGAMEIGADFYVNKIAENEYKIEKI